MSGFERVPHPHLARRAATGPVTASSMPVDGGWVARFNAKVGLRITLVVGTMWCAYAFTVLALVSAPAAVATGSPLIIVAWVAQTFLQLVLLPIIIVGQNVQAKAADARAEATWLDAEAILHECLELHRHLDAATTAGIKPAKACVCEHLSGTISASTGCGQGDTHAG